MIKKIMFVCVSIVILYSSSLNLLADQKSEHIITTCKDLESIGHGENYLGATHDEAWALSDDYIVVNNIDCSATNPNNSNHDTTPENTYGSDGFESIGTEENPFTGTFNGQMNTINNLYINVVENYFEQGLFGYVSGGQITNINMVNVDISGWVKVGSIAGNAVNGTSISNCAVQGVVNGHAETGGIVGIMRSGSIDNVYFNGTVSSGAHLGGIVGWIQNSIISNSYSTGEVKSVANNYEPMGGLVGSTIGDMTISNSYSSSDVTGMYVSDGTIGGLVGLNEDNLQLINSYSYEDQVITSNGESNIVDESSIIGAGDEKVNGSLNICTKDNISNINNWYTDVLKWDTDNIWDVGIQGSNGNIIYPHFKNMDNQINKDIE